MSINNLFNIDVFLPNIFTLEIFYNNLLWEKTKEYEDKNYNIKVREKQAIFKFIILQRLYIAKTIYGINDIKINEKYMQELNKLIMEDFNDVFDEDHNNPASINAKKKYDFILKHDNISDEFSNDYIKVHNELEYE